MYRISELPFSMLTINVTRQNESIQVEWSGFSSSVHYYIFNMDNILDERYIMPITDGNNDNELALLSVFILWNTDLFAMKFRHSIDYDRESLFIKESFEDDKLSFNVYGHRLTPLIYNNHVVLIRDKDVVYYLESDAGYGNDKIKLALNKVVEYTEDKLYKGYDTPIGVSFRVIKDNVTAGEIFCIFYKGDLKSKPDDIKIQSSFLSRRVDFKIGSLNTLLLGDKNV